MSNLNYFLLSDLHKPVQVKIVGVKGRALQLALGVADKQSKAQSNNQSNNQSNQSTTSLLQQFHDFALNEECELFIEASIYSGGARVGQSSYTSYRRSLGLSSASIAAELDQSNQSNTQRDTLKFSEWLSFPVKYPDLLPSSQFVFTVWGVRHPAMSAMNGREEMSIEAIKKAAHTHANRHINNVSSNPSNNFPHTQSTNSHNEPVTCSYAFPLGGTSMPMFNRHGLLKLGRRRLLLWLGNSGDGQDPSSTPHKVVDASNNQSVSGPTDGLAHLESLIYRYDQRELPCDVKWLDKLALNRIAAMQVRELSQQQPCSALKLMQAATSNLGTSSETSPLIHPDLALHLMIEFPAFPHPVVFFEKKYLPPLPSLGPVNDHERLFVLHDPELGRDNPVDLKYHKLSRSSKGMSDRDLKPKISERRALDRIIASPVPRLTMDEKELLWKFRFSLIDDRRAATKFLRCVDWSDVNEANEALSLLRVWSPVEIASALELLSSSFPNESVRAYAVQQLERADEDELASFLLQLVQALRYESVYPSPLSTFLVQRCCTSLSLSNFLYWYLNVERDDVKKGPMFLQLQNELLDALRTSSDPDRRSWYSDLMAMSRMMTQLGSLSDAIDKTKAKVEKKIDRMRLLLSTDMEDNMRHLRSFPEPVRMAVRPSVLLSGIIGEESTLFKSKLAPILVCFATPRDERYKVIYKRGDDLRQDQLIIQIINLMDALLKKVRLDLQLTPYRVLATSPHDGFVEYVPQSYTVSSVLEGYQRDIRKFFAHFNPTPSALACAMDRFIRSCAGYAVITYLLGIGDRHLDNVMLTTSGHLFHIDFSFIFGRDPKPFPPPIKIIKEMIEAMGGALSPMYKEFRQHCVSAYNLLRQHSNLILNLLSLMADANIPDLSQDMDKNLMKTQEKFRLELNDEQAGEFILAQVDTSAKLLIPQVAERFHQIALLFA